MKAQLTHYNLSLIECNNIQLDTSWNWKNVNSPFNRLYYLTDGECYVEGGGKRHDLEKNRFYLIPANNTFSYCCENTAQKMFFHFTLEIIPGISIFSDINEIVSVADNKNSAAMLLKCMAAPTIKNALLLKGLLECVLSDFIEPEYRVNPKLYEYNEILNLIEENLSAQLRLSELTEKTGRDFYKLSCKFKADTGINLKEYAQSLLLKRIKQLLITGSTPIKAIAEKYSFSDPYYLSRFFKLNEGMSPREYREKNTI